MSCAAKMASGLPVGARERLKGTRRQGESAVERGEPCPWTATRQLGGHSLCFVHASVVELGMGSLADVLEGRRR